MNGYNAELRTISAATHVHRNEHFPDNHEGCKTARVLAKGLQL